MTEIICTGRGTHEERRLKVSVRYHKWDRTSDGPRTTSGDSPSGNVPVDRYEYTAICRGCRPRLRQTFTPEKYELLRNGVLPTVDISYMS